MISWFLFILQTTTTGKLDHSFPKWFYFIFRCGKYILDLLFLMGKLHLKGQKVKKNFINGNCFPFVSFYE